jgi:Ca2+-binding EF-hand superfamily protein
MLDIPGASGESTPQFASPRVPEPENSEMPSGPAPVAHGRRAGTLAPLAPLGGLKPLGAPLPPISGLVPKPISPVEPQSPVAAPAPVSPSVPASPLSDIGVSVPSLPPPDLPATPARSYFRDDWELHEEKIVGSPGGSWAVYLVDRDTGVAYLPSIDGWPEPTGMVASDGAYVDADAPGVASVDLFALMDAFLKKHKRRLRDVWDAHDTQKRGRLSYEELRGFIEEFTGSSAISAAQRKYLEVVLTDVRPAGASYEGLVKMMKECKDRKRKKPHPLVAPGLSDTPAVLDRLKSYMFNNMMSAKRIFASLDAAECGSLEIEQLRQLVQKIAPDVSESEKRRLTAGLAWMDPSGEAIVRYIDLIRCAKIAKLKVEPMSWGEVSNTPPAKEFVERADRKADKRLEEKLNGPAPTRPRPTAAKTPVRGPAKTPAAMKRHPGAHGGIAKSPKSPGKVKVPVKLAAGTPKTPASTGSRRPSIASAEKQAVTPVSSPPDPDSEPRKDKPPRPSPPVSKRPSPPSSKRPSPPSSKKSSPPTTKKSAPATPSSLPPVSRPNKSTPTARTALRSARPDELRRAKKIATLTTSKKNADEDDSHPKPLYPEPAVEEWELERALTHDGTTYLVDRYNGSNTAYDDSGEWPVSVGELVEDSDPLNRMFDSVSKPMIRIVRSTGTRDAGAIFDRIDTMLKGEHRRLRDVFDEHDRNKDGVLTGDELGRFVKASAPDATLSEVRYFGVMCDVKGEGSVRFEGLIEAIRECTDATQMAQAARHSDELAPVMSKLRDFMRENGADARKVFEACDLDGSGELEVHELRQMIKELQPDVTPGELRHLLAGFREVDTDGNGTVTYKELLRGLRLVKIVRVSEGHHRKREAEKAARTRGEFGREPIDAAAKPAALPLFSDRVDKAKGEDSPSPKSVSPPKPASPPKSDIVEEISYEDDFVEDDVVEELLSSDTETKEETKAATAPPAPRFKPDLVGFTPPDWTLEAILVGRETLLFDRGTRDVFGDCDENAGEWPVHRGVLDEDGHVVPSTSGAGKDLFEELDRCLKHERVRLRDLFEEYDFDDDGRLERGELARFARRVIPEATREDVTYFRVMMDADGDECVTFDEIIECVKRCKSAGVSMRASSQSSDVPEALVRVIEFMKENSVDPRRVFDACDLDGSGFLDFSELTEMIKELVSDASALERRLMLAGMRTVDGDCDGRVSYTEMLRAARLVNLKVLDSKGKVRKQPKKGDVKKSAVQSRPARKVRKKDAVETEQVMLPMDPSVGQDWRLRSMPFGDETCLMDDETRLVFTRTEDADVPLGERKKPKRKPIGRTMDTLTATWRTERRTDMGKHSEDDSSDDEWDDTDTDSANTSMVSDEGSNADKDGASKWPGPLRGKLAPSGKLIKHAPLGDLFDALKEFLQRNKVSLRKLVKMHDTNKKGSLTLAELAKLVRGSLLPGVTDSELSYYGVMLDRDGDGFVTLRDFEECVAESARWGRDVAPRSGAPSPWIVMQRVSIAIESGPHAGDVAAFYYACLLEEDDRDASALLLDSRRLLKLVKELFAGISHMDARCAVANLRACDISGDATISLPELTRALRQATVGKVLPGEGFGRVEAPAAEEPDDDAKENRDKEALAKKAEHARLEMDTTSGATAHVHRYRTGKLSDTTNRGRSGTPVKIQVRPESPEDDPWDSIPAPSPARGGSPPEPYSRFGPSPPKKPTVNIGLGTTTVPLPADKPKKTPRTAKEELELKKRLRAEKIRAEKKVAKGDVLPDDAREEILAAQELLMARKYEKELTMKRVREHLIEEEEAKVQVAEAWREEERIAQEEYERAMLAYQQDHLDQFGYYDDEGDATVRDYFEAQRRARVDEEVLRKWKTEELLAMAQESGPKLAEALAALKRGHDGKIAPESLAAIQEAVREGVAAEAEGNLRVVNSTDIAAGSNATQEILTGLVRVTDEHRQMEKEDEADDAAFVARMRAEYPNSGDWNDDEMEPVPGIERPESLFSPLFSKYAETVGFKSHSEFNETVPAVKRLQFVDQ